MLTALAAGLAVYILSTFRRLDKPSILITYFALALVLGSVIFAGVSYILSTEGWAQYARTNGAGMERFVWQYVWSFFDMIPAIALWTSLPVTQPLEPTDMIAGIPLILFRLYVLLFIFTSLRQWWKTHAHAVVGEEDE